jgi:hypothetical protein
LTCSTCVTLTRALDGSRRAYAKACSASLRRVTSRYVAYDVVEMERAKSDLAMHRSICLIALAEPAAPATKPPKKPAQ